MRQWGEQTGVTIVEGDDGSTRYNDIVVLGGDTELCERVFGRLANGGVFNLVLGKPLDRPVAVDIGRIHYDHLLVVGAGDGDLSAAYQPVRTQLKAGGITAMLGAAGPMGQMHLLRGLTMPRKPRKIVATNLHAARMEPVRKQFARQAAATHVELVYLARDQFASEEAFYSRMLDETAGRGYDDIVSMAPAAAAIERASQMVAGGGVVNMFAGLARSTQAAIDLNAVSRRSVRFTGASGSSIADLVHMRDLVESKQLPTNRSVVAVAGMEGVVDGLHAVAEGRFAGKVVVYPNLAKALPLTPLHELAKRLPSVAAKLDEDGGWTGAAEEELLRLML
jgi:hypothetical protein